MDRQEFFDRQARDWDATGPHDLGPRLARVIGEAKLLPKQRVLDVGTGTGVLIPLILEAVGPSGGIVTLDSSSEMLGAARGKGFPNNVAFVRADMQHAPMLDDARFDRVICNATFPHFADRRKALAEMARVLRPGGLLIISHPIGRAAVNALHRQQGEIVAQDRVPAPAEMRRLLAQAGLEGIRIIDEPEFYLAAARRRKVLQIRTVIAR